MILSYNEKQLVISANTGLSMVSRSSRCSAHRTVLENHWPGPSIRRSKPEEDESEAQKWLGRVGLEGQAIQISSSTVRRDAAARVRHRPRPTSKTPTFMLMDEGIFGAGSADPTGLPEPIESNSRGELQKTIRLYQPRSRRISQAGGTIWVILGTVCRPAKASRSIFFCNRADPTSKILSKRHQPARACCRVPVVMRKDHETTATLSGEVITTQSGIRLSRSPAATRTNRYRVMKDGQQVWYLGKMPIWLRSCGGRKGGHPDPDLHAETG